MHRISLVLRPERMVPRQLHAFRDQVFVALWLGAVLVLGIAVR